jgi:hypothetical protein
MCGDVTYEKKRHLRKKRHVWQIRHLRRNRASSYRALSLAAIFIRPGSRTQVMNYAQNVIYDEMQLACTNASSPG